MKRIALTMRLDEQPGETTPVAAAVMNACKTTARQPNRVGVKRSLPVMRDDGRAGAAMGQTVNPLIGLRTKSWARWRSRRIWQYTPCLT
ncbi:hypothetical protein ACNKHM_14785 [Shigella sonnei]